MSLVDNIDRVAFATAFEVDKIFSDKFSGSFSVGASSLPGTFGNIATFTVAQTHGAGVLPVMQFSTDNSTWYDAGSMKYNTGPFDYDMSATCYTTANSVVIVGQNFTGGAQTCYFRGLLISET